MAAMTHYDPHKDSLESWRDAVRAIREQLLTEAQAEPKPEQGKHRISTKQKGVSVFVDPPVLPQDHNTPARVR
jgi:hypothetical protein